MDKNKKNPQIGENGKDQNKPKIPTKDTIRKWTENDLNSAIYFLSMVKRYPDILDKVADEIYQKAIKEEQGSAIDHVKAQA